MRENLSAMLRTDIARAFRGAELGDGVSLKQAAAIDAYGEGLTPGQFSALSKQDVTQNWAMIPQHELKAFEFVSHLDAAGLRYYIPALMLSLLSDYDPASMRVIGTLQALCPKKDSWAYHMQRYSLLSNEQKAAVARFLQALPQLVSLQPDDRTKVERSLKSYWHAFLAKNVAQPLLPADVPASAASPLQPGRG